MEYKYKQLGESDVFLLKQLLKVFGEAFEDAPTYQDAVPSDAYLQTLLAKPTFIALVAVDASGEVVGGLAAYVLEKFEQARSEVYIYDLAVAEAHRRRGVATQLIMQLKSIARGQNAYVIYVQADIVDQPAMRLYESLGIKEEVLHFDIPVE